MQHFEFSYTTVATGQRTVFSIQDATPDAALANVAISEEVARTIRAALKRLTTITDVTVTRVSDERVVNRDDVAPDP